MVDEMENLSKHISILVTEILDALQPSSGGTYLDGTFGGGGHTRAILERSQPEGRVIAVDRDPTVSVFAEELIEKYGNRFRFEPIPYDQVSALDTTFDGAVLDLGMSTDQLFDSYRGFSFQKIEPLDLRFNTEAGQSAAQFLQQSSRQEIERVFREYAEDRYARRLAATIATERRRRPIRTTTDFVSYVGTDNPTVLAPLFQALRIQVNDELTHVKRGISAIWQVLRPQAVLAVLTFHSLEDKLVKTAFREDGWVPLTKKPIVPCEEEVRNNRSARSAKLRAARKV